MFHHAIMDATDLRRTADLLTLLADHERAQPVSMMELVGAGSVVGSAGAGPA